MSDAQSLSARGLSVIPVPRPRPGARLGEPGDCKIPAIAWREYQTRLPTAAELEQLDGTALDPLKIAAIFVLTEEIVRFARPGADVLLLDVLAPQLARFADAQFIDPSVAAVSNISPASITNALTPLASTGDPGFDANNLIIEYVSNGGSLERAAFVLSSQNAVAMRLSGNDLFSDLTRSGWGDCRDSRGRQRCGRQHSCAVGYGARAPGRRWPARGRRQPEHLDRNVGCAVESCRHDGVIVGEHVSNRQRRDEGRAVHQLDRAHGSGRVHRRRVVFERRDRRHKAMPITESELKALLTSIAPEISAFVRDDIAQALAPVELRLKAAENAPGA